MPETASAGELMLLAFERAGGGPIFTLNGGHIWPLLMAAKEHGTRLIDVRHEQSAAFAAEGWAKVTRTCGMAAVTAGPGVTNSVSALAAARSNDSPLLLIGGRAPVSRWGMGSLQEMDHVAVVASLCKEARTLDSVDDIYRQTGEAIRCALSQRTGPAFLDVPIDTFFGAGDQPEASEHLVPDPGAPPDLDEVGKLVRLVTEAEHPVLLAGSTAWWAGAETELREFVEAASVLVALNGMARGMLPASHPLNVTRARSEALGEADLVVVVGAPLDFRLNFGLPPVIADHARIAYVDVDDFRKHRPASAAVYGDLRRSLSLLAEAAPAAGRPDWAARMRSESDGARIRDREAAASNSVPIHPTRLLVEVEAFCDRDAIFVGDGGDFISFAGRLIERDQPGQWIDGGPFGCLGSGPGYAMAAKLRHPDRQVVLLSGDGAFGFSAMEFDTLVRHRIPIVCVVGNNGIWATEKHPMESLLGESIAAELQPGTRYDRVVEALGGYGELVERPDQIGPALERAFRSGLPACLNVLCDPASRYPRSSVLM